jgi:hypothetical protein
MNTSDIAQAVRNDAVDTFTLSNPKLALTRTFEIKHLEYDAYIEFCDLARPILQAVATGLDLGAMSSDFKLQFNPAKIDFSEIIRLAGKELPRMAWLCCKQTDPKITVDEVKRLGYRPQMLLNVVLKQIKHNEMVQEFADFFPLIAEQFAALLPAAQEAMTPIATAPTE